LHIKQANNKIIFKCLMEVGNATLSNREESSLVLCISKKYFICDVKVLMYLS